MEKKKMTNNQRARQFLPFDALKGLREALKIKELEHERIAKRDISADKAEHISNILISLDDNSYGSVLYYDGGLYYNIKGKLKLDISNGCIYVDKEMINLDDIFDILLEE